jgi:hypothetical protein
MALASDKQAIVSKLDCLADESQIVIAPDKIDLVFECAKLCREPVRAAALLDRQGYWQHEQVSRPNLWQDLARTYGPALNDPEFPDSAIVAGFGLLGDEVVVDADIFVPNQAECDKVLALLYRWGYTVTLKSGGTGTDLFASYDIRSVTTRKVTLDVIIRVTALANDPPRLARRFEAACCELWTRRSLGDYVMVSASAALAIATRVLPDGRFGPLSDLREAQLVTGGYTYHEEIPRGLPSTVSALVHHASEHYLISPQDVWHKLKLASDPSEPVDRFPLLWTDYLDVVASDEGRSLVLRPRPDQEADLLRHGVRCDRIWGLSLPLPGSGTRLQVRLLLALAEVPRYFEPESQAGPVQREFKAIYYVERHVGRDTLVIL